MGAKTYIFIGTSRKEPSWHVGTVTSDSPEDAIKQMNHYPYDPDDFEEVPGGMNIEQTARAYYGLVEGEDSYMHGNGPDGYGTTLIEYDSENDETKLYPGD